MLRAEGVVRVEVRFLVRWGGRGSYAQGEEEREGEEGVCEARHRCGAEAGLGWGVMETRMGCWGWGIGGTATGSEGVM